jgi:hypothetical protein
LGPEANTASSRLAAKSSAGRLMLGRLNGLINMTELPRLLPERRNGAERFRNGSVELPLTLHDFWCWSTSDLLNNTTRGVLAEFLVATALQIPTSGVRDPWAAYDLCTADGMKIEVKSAAYLQSWAQQRPSSIVFNVPRTRAWDPETNQLASDAASGYSCFRALSA